MKTTLILVRHGQSTWNAEGRWQGQADPPLNDVGRKQAKMAAKRLGEIHVVVSSPQIRALETATIIADAKGIDTVVTHDDLCERNAGEWSGLTKDEIEDRFPRYLAGDRRPPNYESDVSLLSRSLAALNQTAETYPGAVVLISTHGGVIKTTIESMHPGPVRIPNLAGWILSHVAGQFRVIEPLNLLPKDMSTGGDHMRV